MFKKRTKEEKILIKILKKKQQIKKLKAEVYEMGKFVLTPEGIKRKEDVEAEKLTEKKVEQIQTEDVSNPAIVPEGAPQPVAPEPKPIEQSIEIETPEQVIREPVVELGPLPEIHVEEPTQPIQEEEILISIVFTNNNAFDLKVPIKEVDSYINQLEKLLRDGKFIELDGKLYNPSSVWYIDLP